MNNPVNSEPARSKFKKALLPVVVIISIFSFSFVEDLFQVSKNLDIFAAIYKQLSINYVDDVSSSEMMKNGIDAMLEELDPYTEYIPESDIEDYKLKYVSTQYGGIGATISNRAGKVVVAEPYAGFPAQKADIRAGDEFLEINGVSLKGKTNEQVSSMLKGSKGTPVKLRIQRPGMPKSMELNLTREEIRQNNVPYYGMLSNNVGYIKLDKFLENSAQEVKDALAELKKNNINGLVLDLRFNGGGILQEAVKIVNLFVDKGVTVVIQKGRNREKSITYNTFSTPLEPNLPLVVLVNNRSASASEIVAGSLQDLDRAVVIGQRSFGKGLVQQTFNLPYNSLVKVTVAKYYTPSGRCIQALDYTHRDTDGMVVKVADSLITEYKTKSGRSVYDGSGIFPDVFVKPMRYSLITQTLASRYHIFDYATQYRNLKTSIGDAKNFRLSDAEYNDFIAFLSKRDYNYDTRVEKLLNELRDEAEKENKIGDLKPEFDALKAKVSHSKKNDLVLFKDEIRKVLESEIVSRYYFEKGRLEQNFKYDNELNEAQKVLSDKSVLASILNGEGTYKSIGKPGEDYSANVK
ncbi:MAG: peptidase S41 [Sphingobacteriales bacterium 17-39-43]|uniref:S41 family peptidase n=1 Tax=Daejeonella sp. TaxID=2805397 RepID=UPI000BD690E6|nr:S41 family peptidase [Daejeonella sp.]OYZ32491.1 MAG: peptidase S41 [Sphingobacteriales bacterium 16-39-50]OZA25854.1 MAG: peptidase S41 [Sphingobacteriales bacterium 17-39-43]HQT21948.1 S41 family peptidase [Daejeonella sp.]HQT57255.1 S41 family peptidase [Daejeonella sp.]